MAGLAWPEGGLGFTESGARAFFARWRSPGAAGEPPQKRDQVSASGSVIGPDSAGVKRPFSGERTLEKTAAQKR